MLKITRGYLEKLINENNVPFTLKVYGKNGSSYVYSLYNGGKEVFTGSASEINAYLMGFITHMQNVYTPLQKNVLSKKLVSTPMDYIIENEMFMVKTRRCEPPYKYSYSYTFEVKEIKDTYQTFYCDIVTYEGDKVIHTSNFFEFSTTIQIDDSLEKMFRHLIEVAIVRCLNLHPNWDDERLEVYAIDYRKGKKGKLKIESYTGMVSKS